MAVVNNLLLGYATVLLTLVIGYISRRLHVTGDTTVRVVNKLNVNILMPALYFVVLAEAQPALLVSRFALATVVPTVGCMALILLILSIFRKHLPWTERILLTVAGVFVNSGNIGIPIAVSVLGATSYLAPMILVQVLFLSPALLALLTMLTGEADSPWRRLQAALTTPIVIAALLGLAASFLPTPTPELVLAPLRLVGEAAIPMMLLTFGMSIVGARPLSGGPDATEMWISVATKVVLFPSVTLLTALALGIAGNDLLALVVIAALPTAQNIYAIATTFGVRSEPLRDAILASTALSLPAAIAVVTLV